MGYSSNVLFQISRDCVTENARCAGKIFGKICTKAIRDTFFFQCIACDLGIEMENQLFGLVISNRRGKFKILGLQGDLIPYFLP